jgi:predicted nuclease of predicted toxin-antitoxin system
VKLLLDEQISGNVADLLRRKGHDAIAVADDALLRGRSDSAIFARAQKEGRVVVTYDREDFERLAREHDGYGKGHQGLVIVNSGRFPENDFSRLAAALAALVGGPAFGGSFVIWLQEIG